ncbi:hypothetical protein CQA49_04225 [Helicobacter sp. MIT 00-7814]|uniref:hypothetical protein n=1 Tax=unclassified Helicobacter TaxID=2593540 RepID=UPI000E1F27C8|nr:MULTISPECIES: hypothetical protein [unclassified Helicobacter]RDU51940.1 hypothetical protein CQA37_09140 [Helicobacter sp. MIT 99-10781]RDU55041.1 hypothetical protein CQA49_04225 [Helicobacter sp. MIT 00-7814]
MKKMNFAGISKRLLGGLLIGSLGFVASLSAQESGVFVAGALGAMINGSDDNMKYTAVTSGGGQVTSFTREDESSTSNINLSYGVRAGYVLALNQRSAFRVYGSFSAGTYTMGIDGDLHGFDKQDFYLMRAGAGIDYMLSFSTKPNAWGLAIGGGYEYGFGKLADELKDRVGEYSMDIPYANIAFFKLFGNGRSTLEFGFKIPFVTHWKFERKNDTGQVQNEPGVFLNATGINQLLETGTKLTPYVMLSYRF